MKDKKNDKETWLYSLRQMKIYYCYDQFFLVIY